MLIQNYFASPGSLFPTLLTDAKKKKNQHKSVSKNNTRHKKVSLSSNPLLEKDPAHDVSPITEPSPLPPLSSAINNFSTLCNRTNTNCRGPWLALPTNQGLREKTVLCFPDPFETKK